jgi:hypothetical protein
VSYDDVNALQEKVNYIRNNNLGGIIIWELSQDYYSSTNQPLLQDVNSAWGNFYTGMFNPGGGFPSGRLAVAPNPPNISSVSQSSNGIVISGSGGTSNGTYYVRGSINLAVPPADWEYLSTNRFDKDGNFSLTIPVNSTIPQRFIRIQLP